MVISLVFTALFLYLGLKLLRYERIRGTLQGGEDYKTVYFFAVLVGLWSAFVFAVPGVDAVYRYSNQRGVDYLQSEIPAENPPLLPAMSRREFVVALAPSVLGVSSSLLYTVLAVVMACRRKMFPRSTYFVIGWDLLMRIWHLAKYPYFRPLPTLSQNILFGILWALPFLICTFFSLYWFWWAINRQKAEVAQSAV